MGRGLFPRAWPRWLRVLADLLAQRDDHELRRPERREPDEDVHYAARSLRRYESATAKIQVDEGGINRSLAEDAELVVKSINGLSFVFLTILSIIIGIGIINTCWISVQERSNEIGCILWVYYVL